MVSILPVSMFWLYIQRHKRDHKKKNREEERAEEEEENNVQ